MDCAHYCSSSIYNIPYSPHHNGCSPCIQTWCGSSMNTIEGLATSSTAIVNLFRCSVDKPSTPGRPTNAPLSGVSSTSSITSSTKACKIPYSNQIVPKSHKNYKIQFIFTRWISKVTSDGNRSQAENRSDSRTVKQGEWMSVCSQ